MLRTLLALGSVFALAACASSPRVDESAAPGTNAATEVAAATASTPPAPAAAPIEQAAPAIAADPAPAAKADKTASGVRPQTAALTTARPRSADQPSPRQLVGRSRDEIQNMLGYPWLLKREGTAELWQYRVPACVLDLFMFGPSSEELKVAHVELRGRRENKPPTASCYSDILSTPRPPTHQTAKGYAPSVN